MYSETTADFELLRYKSVFEMSDLALAGFQFVAEKVSKTHMGGTMRLGARKTLLQTADCISAKL